jgi:hypothetical protein
VIVSKELLAAAAAIAAAPRAKYEESVQERAREIVSHLRPGQKLARWQVELLQCLRSRFMGDYGQAEQDFENAFGKAYDEWDKS